MFPLFIQHKTTDIYNASETSESAFFEDVVYLKDIVTLTSVNIYIEFYISHSVRHVHIYTYAI